MAGCATETPSPAPTLIVNACAIPKPCLLPARHLRTNGDLLKQLEETEASWALCAQEIDGLHQCMTEALAHQ
ncbi:Rz1-like lysis system protein LysC [Zymobacter sp. IVIA_5232.4 C2]|uniref:Rz1-like lysis system protein LysC n=1 Tax=Zymobacter sp. IVIA_5232.4 C2 TaxID=3394855 RepID=UPI0039C15D21